MFEGEKKASVTVAEGKKESAILEAEAENILVPASGCLSFHQILCSLFGFGPRTRD